MVKNIIFVLVFVGSYAGQPKTQQKRTYMINYLALGDSYTIGESVSEVERFPVQLVDYFNTSGLSVGPPRIVAQTGWTTDELLAAISSADLVTPYGLVSLLIGVNNQFRGYDPAIYEREFEALLHLAIAKAGGWRERVFVISIPDYGVTPFAADRDPAKIGQEIEAYNAANLAISQRLGVRYFDITHLSRLARTEASLLTDDALHPSAKMYAAWVDLMKNELLKLLQQ